MSTSKPPRAWRSPRRRPSPATRQRGHPADRVNATMHAELDGTVHAARQARNLVTRMLGEDHPSASDATLVVSELVANAVAYTRSGQPGGTLCLTVQVSARPRSVLIAVRDAGSPTVPTLTAAAPGSEHGRGLAIVAVLAADWGTEPAGTGRSTWCRLTPEPAGRAARAPRQAARDQQAIVRPRVPELEAGQ
jgi:anti-sigma regulatory factor (Ser/Thr protein kinase)